MGQTTAVFMANRFSGLMNHELNLEFGKGIRVV
jgi:hypothetical protein